MEVSNVVVVDPEKRRPATSELFELTYQGLVEGLTGLATSDKRELVRSVGFVFQRLRSVKFLDALRIEWNKYREKGRIRDGYEATEQHAECLQEMLDFLDHAPDERKFTILKKILLVSATEEHSSRETILPQQYMSLVRQLSSGELLVLLTTYTIARREDFTPVTGAREWLQRVASASGLRFGELVEIHEEQLMAKHLLTERTLGDRSGVNGRNNRLTDLGYQLCEFISHYEE